jgi:hypothetical protein
MNIYKEGSLMTCSTKSVKKSLKGGKTSKNLALVELEGDSVLYKIGADRITMTIEELISQLSKYGYGVSMSISVPILKIKAVKKKIYHDISCNCYDCRAGVSLKAKD